MKVVVACGAGSQRLFPTDSAAAALRADAGATEEER